MRFQIKHEIEGRLRVHMMQSRMTFAEADTLQYYLEGLPGVAHAKVYEKTCDAVVTYTAERADIITALKQFCYDRVELPTAISGHSSREMNAEYQSRLIGQTLIHFREKAVPALSRSRGNYGCEIRKISVPRGALPAAAQN